MRDKIKAFLFGYVRFAFLPTKTKTGWIWFKYYTKVKGKRAEKIPR